MDATRDPTTIKTPGTPKPWMNAAMRAMLRTPGIGHLLGRMFAIITVTGARTGRRYTTPIQYFRDGDEYVVLSQQHRTWWRNIRTRPEVELVVRGRTLLGRATIAEGDEARRRITHCLEQNPRVAKFYEIEVADDGTVAPDGVDALTERVVAIVVDA